MPKSLWRNRDFLLVLGGGFVNNVGDWLLAVALPAFVYTQTGSGRATATIVVTELVIGVVFGPYGGSLADRWDLRRTIIATNVAQAAGMLPLLAVTPDRVWPAFLVAGIQGLLAQINNPASFAIVPRIVPSEQLVTANSANSAGQSIARLLGAPLGGIAVALGGLSTVVVVDAITFLTVAVATTLVRTPTASLTTSDGTDRNEAGVRAGLRELGLHAGLKGYLGAETVAALTFAMFPVLFIAFVVDVLNGDEATVGIIRGSAAFGGIAAAVMVGRLGNRADPTRLMMWGYIGLGAVAFVFVNITAITTALWVFLLLFALSGLPNITSQVGATTTAQRLCPPAALGRLQGLLSAATSAGAIVGSVAVGLLVDDIDVKALLNAQATLFVLSGIVTYVGVIRRIGQQRPTGA
ncbi:MAG TPA: MFS transporter [Acidimicrobiia bacterium]